MKKGFTLIELLIVIGILAVLATVTVLVLNPAELFRQARDSQRMSDLGTLKNAIGLYLTTEAVPVIGGGTQALTCGSKFGADKAGVTTPFTGLTQTTLSATPFATDGSGYIPVAFSTMTGGSPISTLPRDPTTTGTAQFYAYACGTIGTANELTFEIDTNMESTKYVAAEGTDGGNNAGMYEIGTVSGLSF